MPCRVLERGRRSAPAAAAATAGSEYSIGVVSASGSEKRRGRFCSHCWPAAGCCVTYYDSSPSAENDDTTQGVASLWFLDRGGLDWIPLLVGVGTHDDDNAMTLGFLCLTFPFLSFVV